jgi:putative pyruvate formate lyase activating enzyme
LLLWCCKKVMTTTLEPAYLNLPGGELQRRADQAWARLEDCDLCPRQCHVNRRQTTKGAVCRTGERAVVASFGPHFGEEKCLVGRHGSGTIFFSWCNLRCQFCQNYDISQLGEGRAVEAAQIAAMMLDLQERGCHNINFVSPSHVMPQILAAVAIAAVHGLRVPLVYNTGGYDALTSLELLDGVVDIYMPDVKYADAQLARKYSKVRDYPARNQAAVKEMHRQVGDLILDENGVARHGLLVRHLVLPNAIAGTADIVRFLAEEISTGMFLNVMDQYRPCFKAGYMPDLNRPISRNEYREAIRLAEVAGLHRLAWRGPRWFLAATE